MSKTPEQATCATCQFWRKWPWATEAPQLGDCDGRAPAGDNAVVTHEKDSCELHPQRRPTP